MLTESPDEKAKLPPGAATKNKKPDWGLHVTNTQSVERKGKRTRELTAPSARKQLPHCAKGDFFCPMCGVLIELTCF